MTNPYTIMSRRYRQASTRTQEELYEARNQIDILTRHNEQLRTEIQQLKIQIMENHNRAPIEQAEAAKQIKANEEHLKQVEQEHVHTVGTYMQLMQGRNPQGRFDYADRGMAVVLQSKASTGMVSDDDDFRGPWDANWKPKH